MRKNQNSRRFLGMLGVLAAVVAGWGAGPAAAAPADFLGVWVNTNHSSPGLVRVQITAGVHGLGIRPFGACTPSPCDWGIEPLSTYGDNISDADHTYGTAEFNHGFAVRAMTCRLIDTKTLVVETYSKFLDGSGRQNYHSREVFKKIVILPIHLPLVAKP